MRFSLFPVLLTFSAFAAAPDPKAIERGKQAFVQACGFCHGNDATGSRGHDLVLSPLVTRDKDANLIGPAVKKGRPDKGSPACAISDDQLSDCAEIQPDHVRDELTSYSR